MHLKRPQKPLKIKQYTLRLCKAISSALARKEECHILNDQTTFMYHLHGTRHILDAVRTKAVLVSALDLPLGYHYEVPSVKEKKKPKEISHSTPTSIQGELDNFCKFLLKTPNFYPLPFFASLSFSKFLLNLNSFQDKFNTSLIALLSTET